MLENFFKKYKEKEEDKFLYLNFQKKIDSVIYFVLFLVNGTILYLLFFMNIISPLIIFPIMFQILLLRPIMDLFWFFKKYFSKNGDYFKILRAYCHYCRDDSYKKSKIIEIINNMDYKNLINKEKFIIKNSKIFKEEYRNEIIEVLDKRLIEEKINFEFKNRNRVKNTIIKEI